MQEAFIAALLVIARHHEDASDPPSSWGSNAISDNGDDDLNSYELWKVMKEQVKILRHDMDSGEPDDAPGGNAITGPGEAARRGPGCVALGKRENKKSPPQFSALGKAGEGGDKLQTTFAGNVPIFNRRLTPAEFARTRPAQKEESSLSWVFGGGS